MEIHFSLTNLRIDMKNKKSSLIRRKGSAMGGFTIVEMIVVLGVLSIVGIVVSDFARNVLLLNSSGQNSLVAQLEGRRVLKTMVAELRTAFPSAFGSYPLESVADDSVVFFANISGNSDTERIRYFYDAPSKSIKKGVTSPSGNPPVYNVGNEVVTTLITDIANGPTPLFEYFDSSYTGTEDPLILPVDISRIRLIRINVLIDRDATHSPALISLTSEVSLRNLKDNL